MELAARRRDQQQHHQQHQHQQHQHQQRDAAAENGGQALSGQSYWLDLWLFVLFDLAFFVVIYLLP